MPASCGRCFGPVFGPGGHGDLASVPLREDVREHGHQLVDTDPPSRIRCHINPSLTCHAGRRVGAVPPAAHIISHILVVRLPVGFPVGPLLVSDLLPVGFPVGPFLVSGSSAPVILAIIRRLPIQFPAEDQVLRRKPKARLQFLVSPSKLLQLLRGEQCQSYQLLS